MPIASRLRCNETMLRSGDDNRDLCDRRVSNTLAVFLGALRAGVAVAPLAPSSTPENLLGMLADCGARKFFLDESCGETHRR